MTEEFNTTSSHDQNPVQNGEANDASASGAKQPSNQDANIAARRKLLKAGLVAGPVLLTLRGRPARAQLPSLGSAGIFYGAYVTEDDLKSPDFQGTGAKVGDSKRPTDNPSSETGFELDPNGNDRRPGGIK